jgi:hypothetical protein
MGEYVVILHSDDLLNKNFFKDLVPLLDQYPMAVMAVGERIEINEQGDILLSPAPFYDGDYLIPGVEQAKVFLVSGFLPCQVLFRRNVVLEFGGAKAGFQVNLDGLLWFKASLFGDIAYRQNVVSSYRRHQGSLTSNLTPTLTHLFEYYSTIKEMFLFANKQQVDLSGERQRAFDRIADLAIRYSKEIYASGEVELARRFIAFATAVNAGVKDTDAFLDISSAIDQGSEVTNPFSERLISYEPPVGSKPIKVS